MLRKELSEEGKEEGMKRKGERCRTFHSHPAKASLLFTPTLNGLFSHATIREPGVLLLSFN